MNAENQDKFALQLTPNTECLRHRPKAQVRIFEAAGYVADALRKITLAGKWGVHVSEFRVDALARLEQLGVQFESFAAPKRTTGDREEWVRLKADPWFDVGTIGGAA